MKEIHLLDKIKKCCSMIGGRRTVPFASLPRQFTTLSLPALRAATVTERYTAAMRHSAELASWRRPAASAASAGDAPGHASPRAGLRRNADGEDARLLGDADHRSVDVEDERLADKYLHSLPYRSVCVSTRERLLVLLDFFQLFALLWSVSPPWPWPFRWMRDTRFALVANLDVFLLHNYEVAHGGNTPGQALRGRSIWGEYPDLPLLAGCAALLCACIMLAPVVQVWHLKRKEQHWLRPRRALVSKLLLLGELLLLPCALVLLRLLVCRGEEDVLDALPSVACLSWQHLLLASLAGLPLAVFVLGVPLALALRIWPLLVHASTQQHERWLRRKETEYVLFLSDDWLEDGFALTSSFRRPCALHRPAVAAVKLLLALVYALLRARPGVQGSAFFCAFTALLAVHVLARPFRSLSSTLLQLVLDAALVYFSCLGMFKVRSCGKCCCFAVPMHVGAAPCCACDCACACACPCACARAGARSCTGACPCAPHLRLGVRRGAGRPRA